MVHGGFAFDLVQLCKRYFNAVFVVSQGTLLANQRTQLVEKCLEKPEISHILFIDSDMRFPEDTIFKLLSKQLPIIGANCKQRGVNKTTAQLNGKFVSSKGKTGIQEVDKLGFGVTLISRAVFLKIPKPWFATPFDGKGFIGEDIFFCKKAREAGYTIYIDHDLSQEVSHVGTQEFGFLERKKYA